MTPTSSPKLKSLELFAGYGGLGLAVEKALNAHTVAVAEFDPASSTILAHRFPHAPNLHDVTTATWSDVGPVDVISGGSPCQDISGAGRRAGMITGNRSGLWESMRDAIADRCPRHVVWENVRAATTAKASSLTDPDGKLGHLRALGRVLGDLASLGYDAEWRLVKASDVGVCHQRARVFLLAWDRDQATATDLHADPLAVWDEVADHWGRPGALGLSIGGDTYRDKIPTDGAMRARSIYAHPGLPCATPATLGKLLPTPAVADATGGHAHRSGARNTELLLPGIARAYAEGTLSDDLSAWGEYLPAVIRHALTTKMDVPAPSEPGAKAGSRPRLAAPFVEWMMGLPAGWVTDPALGLTRPQQLKALGNGVVPQQAEYAIRAMVTQAGVQAKPVALVA